jgi:hypothetical protein
MPSPVPLTVDQLGDRPFSFYPAVLGIEHNEWRFERSTWSEMLVINRTTGKEVWIPRRFIGEVSRIDEPVVIVGLNKELEYRAGMVVPHERRLLEMPRALNDPRAGTPVERQKPSSMTGGKLGGAESRVGRLLLGVIIAGVVACIAVIAMLSPSRRVSYQAVMQNDLGFTSNDDFYSVVNKLGPPAEDRWKSEKGEMQYRRLSYPQHGLSIILMGTDRKEVRYLGAVDNSWHVVHSANRDTEAMLRALKRF